jgi:ABC-2 type transport system permease protein
MNRNVRVVAWHEYITNVRRKEFILLTLGLPVLMLFFGGLSVLGTTAAVGTFAARVTLETGIVDRSGALDLSEVEPAIPDIRIRSYADENAGLQDVRAGRIIALMVVPADYLATGNVTVYRQSRGLFNQRERVPVGAILMRGLMAKQGLEKPIRERIYAPVGESGARVLVQDRSGAFVPLHPGREAARLILPYLFAILLTTSIFISANYLLRGIAEEKENRVIEVILSSITPETLLRGKLIGLAGVGLTQVGIWATLGGMPALIQFSGYIQLSPSALAGVLLFFALGFGLYATILAGLGALGTSYRESQQVAGLVSFGAFFPIILILALVEFPNGALARILSWIPLTAPTTMVIRMTTAEVPPADILLSALITLAAIWLVLRLSARLFRFGLLIYGKRPTLLETLRWLRQSS